MVKTIHLVRHGHHALLGEVLCGRMTGVELDDLGCRQMARCAGLIQPPPTLIHASPQRRALQSASILANRFGLAIEIVPAFAELDYGEWTGRSFAALQHDPLWSAWNAARGSHRPPGGESMRALQRRVVDHLERLRSDYDDGTIAVVSHAEPIRAALLHYSGVDLDQFLSVEVDPASVSTLSVDRARIRIANINQRMPA